MGKRIDTPVLDATEVALAKAAHLTDMDKGAVEALRALARKIDAWDEIVEWAIDDAHEAEGKRPAVPANDNVSLPTYLKYCEALGLSPLGRVKSAIEKGGGNGSGGTLSKLRAVHGKGA